MISAQIRVPVLLAALYLSWSAAADAQLVVDSPAGKLQGVAVGNVHVFKGIPYAQPPVGPLRWKPPLPIEKWKGVRDATHFGPVCVQPRGNPVSLYFSDLPSISEDCLSLNIWAPATAQKAPVFFWIHGGSLTGGSGSDRLYDGSKLAERGLVVVSINYRLGVLGYFAHPELSAESRQNISGNYGLLDQIAGLQWVKKNISAFGGDAGNVTIAGESAGGLSVMYLLAAPDARGLFARAIAQSAYMVSTPELRTATFGNVAAEPAGVWLAGKLGASDLAALRSMDAETIVNKTVPTGWLPFGTIDGKILPHQLVEVFDRGEQARVPLLAGFNSGEIRSLRVLAPPVPADPSTYEKEIRARYADLANEFLKLYPASDMQESIWATTRDALYSWTAQRLAIKQTALGLRSFLYLFDHGYPAADSKGLHAFHASELPYMFGTRDKTPPNWPPPRQTAAEGTFSDAMLDYWSTFARTGVPSAAGQPSWPPYGSERAYMSFEDVPRPRTNPLPGMYELNEQVVCRRRVKGGIPWHWNVGLAAPPLPEAPCN
jgi:para-nitrobenzyl esterase